MNLTFEEILRPYKLYERSKPIYYVTDEFLPDKNRFWKIPMCGEEVWIVHPDSFAAFKCICGAERIKAFEVTDEMVRVEMEELRRKMNEELVHRLESAFSYDATIDASFREVRKGKMSAESELTFGSLFAGI